MSAAAPDDDPGAVAEVLGERWPTHLERTRPGSAWTLTLQVTD